VTENGPLPPEELDRLLEAIPRILREPSFDQSLADSLELLRRGAGAQAAALFLADGDAPLREVWVPREIEIRNALRPRLKVEALEAIRQGGAHRARVDHGEHDGTETRTLLLSTETGPFGAVGLAWAAGSGSGRHADAWTGAVLEIMAWSILRRGEISKLQVQAERDKRWFKTLDEHLRVLDRERQKFAAVVNQTDTFVFVTDEARTIRWNNRAMAVLLPSNGGGASWVGKSCREVCLRLGKTAHEGEECDCPIRRALERNEVTHEELRVRIGELNGVLYLTALPIKGVDGRPHEAMVLVQDLTGLEALRNSEIRYRVLFERNAEALLIVNAETGGVLLANVAAQQLLGYSSQEFSKLTLASLHPAEDWERLRAVYENPPAEPWPSRQDCRLRTRDGQERVALVSATRVDMDGKSVDLVELVDITERREAQRALVESEARKGAVLGAALDAIISMDHAGRVIEFNAAAERMFGYARADVVGRDMSQLIIPPAYRELHRKALEHYLATGEVRVLGRRMEMNAMRSDGSEFPVEIAITRVDVEGPPVFTGFIRDLTERRHAEQALRAMQERLRTVVANSPIVLFAIDRDGVFTLSEGKALARLGRRENESVGRSVYEMYRDQPQILENMRRGLAGEEFVAVTQVDSMFFETHHVPLRDAEGNIIGLIGVAIDITDRTSLENQLRHAQKMEAIGRLAGGVAHDFNNLLSVIRGHSEVALGRLPESDPLRSHLEEIQKAGSRGALLTRQLLTFSRKDVPRPEVLEIDDSVSTMEAMLHRLLGEDIRLTTRLSEAPLHVRADRGQLEQVIANLAVNARDAMPQGGDLLIEVRAIDLEGEDARYGFKVPPGSYVLLSVVDQGSGMDPAVLTRVFEPFFTTKEPGKGTGLGLSVVYGIVRQAGGDIRVESELGKGSAFRILLPRCDEREEPAGPPEAAPAAPAAKPGGLILLTEDEASVRTLAREMLEILGFEVIEAPGGEEALRLFAQHGARVRALMSDIVMPGMSGVELARRLVKIRPDLKVLLVSGYTNDAFGGLDLDAAGYAFLQKPYMLEDLRRTMDSLISGASVGDRTGRS